MSHDGGHEARAPLERLCMENLLESHEERLYFKDLNSRFLLVSAGWLATEAPGRSLDEVLGKTDFEIFSEPHARAAFEDEQRIIATGRPVVAKIECETYNDRPDVWVSTTKLPLRDADGLIVGTYGISRDVTAQVAAERALAHQAFHDPVTGLPNRFALKDRLDQELLALERRRGGVALAFVDLDDFKSVNDMLGHDAGDEVLVEAGRRLTLASRHGDTVARYGGDEFVLLCPLARHDDDIRLIADRLVRALRTRIELGDGGTTVTCSVGIARYLGAADDAEKLLQRADRAMYRAKADGGDRFHVFDPEAPAAASPRTFDAQLRRAIAEGELFVDYQPLFSFEERSLSGVEALVRWRHPTRGVLAPAQFLAEAERSGLVTGIGAFVLDEAARQLAEWDAHGDVPAGFTVAVNVSARELGTASYASRVAETLARRHVDPSRLCLEVAETALVGAGTAVETTVGELRRIGVAIALDDFGTGCATLAHLRRHTADVLKIDGSVVGQLGDGRGDERARTIIGSVTAMAHALGMSVVGEGVETDDQRAALEALGCDVGQGYLLARPMAPGDVLALRAVIESGEGCPRPHGATPQARHPGRGPRA